MLSRPPLTSTLCVRHFIVRLCTALQPKCREEASLRQSRNQGAARSKLASRIWSKHIWYSHHVAFTLWTPNVKIINRIDNTNPLISSLKRPNRGPRRTPFMSQRELEWSARDRIRRESTYQSQHPTFVLPHIFHSFPCPHSILPLLLSFPSLSLGRSGRFLLLPLQLLLQEKSASKVLGKVAT